MNKNVTALAMIATLKMDVNELRTLCSDIKEAIEIIEQVEVEKEFKIDVRSYK